jgi:alkanesulfonate monooxygenase SsuD/methylene tetrahydromethanopterin reductase-like flavin-dependent oxidoreductase (luciferase family)
VRGVGVAFGLVLPMVEGPADGLKPTWLQIRAMAERAEQLGFDTVWTADEILWRNSDWSGPRGWWECLSMTGAVSACTSMVQVGTWVMSALHHNPGMIASAAETLDEICGGRFVLGVGAGHAGGGAKEFGYPADRTVSRYAEALEIIVPLLRGDSVSFHGSVPPRAGRRGVAAWPSTRPNPADVGWACAADDGARCSICRHVECVRDDEQPAGDVRADDRAARPDL